MVGTSAITHRTVVAKPALMAAPARATLASGEPPPTSMVSSQPGDMPSDSAARMDQNGLPPPPRAALTIRPSTSAFSTPAWRIVPEAASDSQSRMSRPLLRLGGAS